MKTEKQQRLHEHYLRYKQTESGKAARKRAEQKYKQTPKGQEVQRVSNRKKKLKFPEKIKAQNAIDYLIRSGKLIRPTVCPTCSIETFIEAHHTDYTKPLEIVWVCASCHKRLHFYNSSPSKAVINAP